MMLKLVNFLSSFIVNILMGRAQSLHRGFVWKKCLKWEGRLDRIIWLNSVNSSRKCILSSLKLLNYLWSFLWQRNPSLRFSTWTIIAMILRMSVRIFINHSLILYLLISFSIDVALRQFLRGSVWCSCCLYTTLIWDLSQNKVSLWIKITQNLFLLNKLLLKSPWLLQKLLNLAFHKLDWTLAFINNCLYILVSWS